MEDILSSNGPVFVVQNLYIRYKLRTMNFLHVFSQKLVIVLFPREEVNELDNFLPKLYYLLSDYWVLLLFFSASLLLLLALKQQIAQWTAI